MQDLSILDEHYQIVFDKCRSALAKLEIRNKEIEETKMVRSGYCFGRGGQTEFRVFFEKRSI